MLKDRNPKLWPVTNFFGINMMPTLIVFACMLPAYMTILIGNSINEITYIGFAVCMSAIAVQTISDMQMRRFRNDPLNKGKHIQSGLWRYSRHPNYLGEVSLWWGVWLIQISMLPSAWWTVFAPVLMTLLFVFISIPMMEKRMLERKEGYAGYLKHTSMLLIFPKRNK